MTSVISGAGALRRYLSALPEDQPLTVVLDDAVADVWHRSAPGPRPARSGSREIRCVPVSFRDVGEGFAWRLAERLRADASPGSHLVAVGGGTVIDAVKLARAILARPGLGPAIAKRAARRGVFTVPAFSDGARLTAVPSTIGTSSEQNGTACTIVGGSNRLGVGPTLAADTAVLDPSATRDLPRGLVVEGVLEAVFRLIGPYIGDDGAGRPSSAWVACLRTLVRGLEEIAEGDEQDDDLRLALARASGTTHELTAPLVREAFSAKHWYLANELATELVTRKVPATAAIVPVVWTRIMQGDARWGGGSRLLWTWDAIRSASSTPLDDDPALGLIQLLDAAGIARLEVGDPSSAASRTAGRVAEAWSSTAMSAFTDGEILSLLQEALATGTSRRPSGEER